MRYFYLVLSLFIIVSVKSSTDNVLKLKINRSRQVTFETDTYYIVTKLDDSDGAITVTIETPKNYSLSNDNFFFRIASSEDEDVEKQEFKPNTTLISTEENNNKKYFVSYEVGSDDKVGILKITGLQNGQTANIEISFTSSTSVALVICFVILILVIILVLILCFIKGCIKCICC